MSVRSVHAETGAESSTAAGAARLILGLIACAAALVSSGCSTAPKRSAEASVVTVKNDAAEFSKLGDGFLAASQYASALSYYGKALDSNLSVDNIEGAIMSRASLGRVYMALGNKDDAERELGDALEDARAFGKAPLVALCLSNLGELRYSSEDAVAADALFAEAEPLAAGDDAVSAVIAHNRGVAAMASGDLAAAEAYVLRAAAANQKASRFVELASNRYALASIAHSRGDLPAALDWAKGALEADKKAENSQGIGADLEALAKLAAKSGDKPGAFDYYRRAFGVWLTLNRAAEAERCLVALGGLASDLGKESYAARYAALLERLRSR